jgi:hypothetical protein
VPHTGSGSATPDPVSMLSGRTVLDQRCRWAELAFSFANGEL